MKYIDVLGHKMMTGLNDRIIGYRLRRGIIYEKASVDAVAARVKAGQTFVNIGAHIGYFTLILAKIVGKSGFGYSFEPNPSNFDLLKENVHLNGYEKNIQLEPLAVGSRSGKANLHLNDRGNQGDHRTWGDPDHLREIISIDMVSLDNYFKNLYKNIDFLKMDVQGYEAEVLNGAKDIFSQNKQLKILMEYWPWGIKKCGSNPIEMLENLFEIGFSVFDISNDGTTEKTGINKLKNYSAKYTNHKNIWLERR